MSSTQQAFPKLDTPLVDIGDGTVKEGVANVGSGLIAIPWYRLLISLWNRTGGSAGVASIPTGTSVIWNGTVDTIPSGCLLEDGTAISRTDFANLFAIIGVNFGAGDGVSTFNLPNRLGKFTYGGLTAGPSGGDDEVTLDIAHLPSHNHPIIDPGHQHTQEVNSGATSGVAGSRGSGGANDTQVGVTVAAPTGVTTDLVGGGAPFPILPSYLQGIPIIGAA